jgi:SAM-dependent methyltransferase
MTRPLRPTGSTRSLEEVAEAIFGTPDDAAYRRWVDYWKRSRERSLNLLADFESLAPIAFRDRSVLDIGCGTGALGPVVAERGGRYVGGDYHRHVLQFARPAPGCDYAQCSGIQLPFPDRSFDLILAFDVIEHLTGGKPWQLRFLKELARVLAPCGMILLTTPNHWYPYDAHTDLYFPHYLPRFLRDRYIRLRNPGFLREHSTFENIQLMKPGFLRRSLRSAGLAPLHDLPCGLDRGDYRKLHPFLGWTSLLGLGWYPHAEFWMILGRRESRERLRTKLRSRWRYESAQPSAVPPADFLPRIDFDSGPHNHQMGDGWYWHEVEARGYRWTSERAVVYLETRSPVRFVRVEGFCPWANRIEVAVEGLRVGEKTLEASGPLEVQYLLPFPKTDRRIFEIEIRCGRTVVPKTADNRRLGVMIFGLELAP